METIDDFTELSVAEKIQILAKDMLLIARAGDIEITFEHPEFDGDQMTSGRIEDIVCWNILGYKIYNTLKRFSGMHTLTKRARGKYKLLDKYYITKRVWDDAVDRANKIHLEELDGKR